MSTSAHTPEFASGRPARVVGVMSGTSLDGLDLCACTLHRAGGTWSYAIEAAETLAYDAKWSRALAEAYALAPGALAPLDRRYGRFLGERIAEFCRRHDLSPDAVASHGHTVHHRPENGYTRQIGDPGEIVRACGVLTVADFRTGDVVLGGQGAPLVPIADRLLFGGYAACVNLGGFANLSFERDGRRVAGDVTTAGVLLNRLARSFGRDYDDGGAIAATGEVDARLIRNLNDLPFCRRAMPKSLGREWLEGEVWPLVEASAASTPDKLATAVEHLADQLALQLRGAPDGDVLLTGGGAFNTFLVARIRAKLPDRHRAVVPDAGLVEFKEALAFALLGALRLRGDVNTLASVTGATRDSCGGVVREVG